MGRVGRNLGKKTVDLQYYVCMDSMDSMDSMYSMNSV